MTPTAPAFQTMSSAAPEIVGAAPGVLTSVANNVNVVGGLWIASSALLTTYSTTKFLKWQPPLPGSESTQEVSVATSLSRPNLLTLRRFRGSLLLGLLAHKDFDVIGRLSDTIAAVPDFIIPASFLFLANYSNSVSLDRIGISLTYTTKCGIPLVTVLLTLLLDGQKALPKIPVLLSLIPIALGIAAASWDHPHFEKVGFLASIASMAAQSALNVSSKRIMSKTGIAGPEAQRAMVFVGFVITSMMAVSHSVREKYSGSKSMDPKYRDPPLWLTYMAVVAYHVEYVLSFMFVGLVAPITYGACDAIRRLGIIVSGHYMFGGHPFTGTNLMGIALALLGALSYSITSHH